MRDRGKFLERARELAELDAQYERNSDLVNDEDYIAKAQLRKKCWPEIVAVVKTEQELHLRHKDLDNPVRCDGCDALEALDKRAGEV